MSNELIRIQPSNMAELTTLATAASKTGFFPGAKSPEQALTLMLTGRDFGLSYMQSVRAFHVIEGKPTMSSDAMVAAVLASGAAEYFTTIESSSESCTVETRRRGAPAPARLTFSMEDARRAELTGKQNWKRYPAAMLKARAKAALARDVYPDVLLGIYTPDEVSDGSAAPDLVLGPPAPEPPPAPPIIDVVPESVPGPSTEAPRASFETAMAELGAPIADVDAFRASRGEPPCAELTDSGRRELYRQLKNGLGATFREWKAERDAVGTGQ